ncbi:hypothetical protein KZ483_23000 [Paenibacillus sp. sptzw28]|nr:hypothetical protein [Paenibacillus sp. sptzw28]QYR20632.1 hypothetical protein KZ483_23000 [Paenibacillus sp. sptzw28]
MKTNEQHSEEELEERKSQELDIFTILEQLGINRSRWPYDLFPPSKS